MTIVPDASVVIAALIDPGDVGAECARRLGEEHLAAPALLAFEVANVLRRFAATAALTDESASLAHADLLELAWEAWPYEALAVRVWGLRGSLTCLDAGYVAVAAELDATLLTLDERLARGAAGRCRIEVVHS